MGGEKKIEGEVPFKHTSSVRWVELQVHHIVEGWSEVYSTSIRHSVSQSVTAVPIFYMKTPDPEPHKRS
jgi:catabolite regulation protein CreA